MANKMDRRTTLRGGAIGVAGLAGGALVGRELLADDNGPRRVDAAGTPIDTSTPMDDHDAGLMSVVFVRDPASQFAAVQEALSASDALVHFLSYTSASLWAVPAGRSSGSVAAGIYE